MGFNFPNGPSLGQTFTPAGGYQYVWDGVAWRVLETPQLFATAQSRNRIANPAMQISQENGDTEALIGGGGYYMADQWVGSLSGTLVSKGMGYHDPTIATPNGSKYRARMRVTTAATPAAAEFAAFIQSIEGSKFADFQWGTASAKQAVLRFGFRGPAGTYSAVLRSGASNASYAVNFTISAGQANTDTEQVFVIPGPTFGTFANDNTEGVRLWVTWACGVTFQTAPGVWTAGNFLAGTGISNGMATVNNYFYLFDVGLYLDPDNTGLAPPWQMPDEAEELRACQRYWQVVRAAFSGNVTTAVAYVGTGYLCCTMRVPPTLTGVNSGSLSFPTTVGTLSGSAGNLNFVKESRAANATANGGAFETNVTASARM